MRTRQEARVEHVTIAQCAMQLEHNESYICPKCLRPVFWKGEGEPTTIRCKGKKGHDVVWRESATEKTEPSMHELRNTLLREALSVLRDYDGGENKECAGGPTQGWLIRRRALLGL